MIDDFTKYERQDTVLLFWVISIKLIFQNPLQTFLISNNKVKCKNCLFLTFLSRRKVNNKIKLTTTRIGEHIFSS